MSKTSCPTAIALGLLVAGCSQSSGIDEVDRVRDRVQAQFGGTELRPVADAAQRAVGRADAAASTRDPSAMAGAVGRGTAEVLCSGVAAKGAVAGRLAREFRSGVPEIAGKRAAVEAYEAVAGNSPGPSVPCG